ncbi:MAG TPA: hypothetical protein VJR92_13200 [Gemmatimonadaceae bacterium]|nr:hypothetical protein [Gemmatimonadaceae bacterium]
MRIRWGTEEERLARVERFRQLGKRRYVLRHGVVGYGLPMFAAMTLIIDRPWTPLNVIVGATVWTLGGALFGLMTWNQITRGKAGS